MIEISGGKTRRRDKRKWFLLLGIFVAVFSFAFLIRQSKSADEDVEAASLANFDPGYIISDWQMSNYNSMSEAEIQAFLTAKNSCGNRDYNYYLALSANTNYRWHWENGHFVCLSEERFGDGEVIGSGDTAAHIIWQAAQDYRINPKVILVLLQKETSLITDPIPNNGDYRKATGYGCPDTAACSSQYYGFKNQVRNAVALFRTVLDGGWTNYPLGNNYIQYNPNAACGGSIVNVRSLATSALYRYTPYQPNAGAIAAGYGTAPCGAYGNRNFYHYFQDWFGGITEEGVRYDWLDNIAEEMDKKDAGKIIKVDRISGAENNYYVLYENGVLYKNGQRINYVKTGQIRDLYRQYGLENGELGYPISDEIGGLKDGASYQLFEKAVVYSHPTLGAHFVKTGPIRDLYRQYGLENGELGYPISDESDGIQKFQNGVLNGDFMYKNEIYSEYLLKHDRYGTTLGSTICSLRDNGCYQVFENGIAYYSKYGVFIVENGYFLEEFRARGRESGIGYPASYVDSNAQQFEYGIIKQN